MSQSDGQQPLLSVKELSKSFGGVRAVVDISFDLRQGELLGLIGPNGSGKTTLVNLITGFIKPDHGKIELVCLILLMLVSLYWWRHRR